MEPADYDAWYRSARGRWIGDTEFQLIDTQLRAARGSQVLDVGCGSGYFTRRLAAKGPALTGIDPDLRMIRYAKNHAGAGEHYLVADAQALPFADRQFDHAVAITSFCFIPDQARALTELMRVTRGRIALGLLNRHSLLYARKGRRGGSGAYRGAHWHTVGEVRTLFAQCGLALSAVRSAIHLPDAGLGARLVERIAGPRLPTGAFLLALGTVE